MVPEQSVGVVWAALVVVVLGIVTAGLSVPAIAGVTYWEHDPAEPGDWFRGGNWTDGVPDYRSNALIDNGGTAEISDGDARALYLQLGLTQPGAVIQTGGYLRVGEYCYVNTLEGAAGAYDLSGGTLEVGNQLHVGRAGLGWFTHSGGICQPANLYVGSYDNADGTYELSGDAVLSADAEYVGYEATGYLQQTSGTNTAMYLGVNAASTYQLTGGTLHVGEGMCLEGSLDFHHSGVSVAFETGLIDLSGGQILRGKKASVTGGTNSILIFAPGFDPHAEFGSFSSSGVVHTAGSTLVVPVGKHVVARGVVVDHVECHGALMASDGNSLDLRGGLWVADGTVSLSQGELTVDNDISGMNGGDLATAYTHVGRNGTGRFSHTGGAHAVEHLLHVGCEDGTDGTYELSGTGQLAAYRQSVGYSGRGTFRQTGGTNTATSTGNSLVLGVKTGSEGTYQLDGGQLQTFRVRVGSSGRGSFVQTGGTHQVEEGLHVSQGTYELAGGDLMTEWTYVYSDTDPGCRFVQTGGTHVAEEGFRLGSPYGSSSYGSYELQDGLLSAPSLSVYSNESFHQTGGTAQGQSLYLSSNSVFELGGSGQLIIERLSMKAYGSSIALLKQTGGSSAIGRLLMDRQSRYEFTGGALRISDVMEVREFDLGSAAVTVEVGDDSWVDLRRASIQGASNASLVVGSNSLTILPSAGDPTAEFATFTTGGLVHVDGTPLFVPGDKSVTGYGSFDDFVQCSGVVRHRGDEKFDLNAGLELLPNGSVDLGEGALNVPGGGLVSSVSGGQLKAQAITIPGSGAFSIIDGSVDIQDDVSIDYWGTVAMEGGSLSAGAINVGEYSSLQQSGGTVTVNGPMAVDPSGECQVGGTAVFHAGSAVIGNAAGAEGRFHQTAGTVTIDGLLAMSPFSSSQSRYDLDAGELSTGETRVGGEGTAVFTHAGGRHVCEHLCVARSSGSNGTYDLSDGELIALSQHVGDGGAALFRQTGGSNAVSYLEIGPDGRYEYTGGTLEADGWRLEGTLDFDSQTFNLDWESAIVSFPSGCGSVLNAENVSLTLGATSLTILPAGCDPSDVFGTYFTAGRTHVLGATLDVPPGQVIRGSGTIEDHVECSGSIVVPHDGLIHLRNGLFLADNGVARLGVGHGVLEVSDQVSGMSSGSELSVADLLIGVNAPGRFVMTGGQLEVGTSLWVGDDAQGSFELAAGSITGRDIYFGRRVSGSFTQSGGSHALSGCLDMWAWDGSTCTYELSAGELLATLEYIAARNGSVSLFHQTGGSNTVEEEICIGRQSWNGPGTYAMDGGALTTGKLRIESYGILDIGSSEAMVTVASSLEVGPYGSLVAVPGSAIHMTGANWQNESTGPDRLAGLGNLELIFEGGPDVTDTFEVAGEDMGATLDGYVSNFALGSLVLGGDLVGKVRLVDDFDNQPAWGGDEALYVESLDFGPGSHIDLNGFNLYFLHQGQPKQLFPGDANVDGAVDGADYTAWADHYGLTGTGWGEGDSNGDMIVDGADYTAWADNYQPAAGAREQAAGYGASGAGVPEPSFAMLVTAGLTVLVRRRRS